MFGTWLLHVFNSTPHAAIECITSQHFQPDHTNTEGNALQRGARSARTRGGTDSRAAGGGEPFVVIAHPQAAAHHPISASPPP